MKKVVVNISEMSPSELGSLVIQAAIGYGCTVTTFSQEVAYDDGDKMEVFVSIEGEHAHNFTRTKQGR